MGQTWLNKKTKLRLTEKINKLVKKKKINNKPEYTKRALMYTEKFTESILEPNGFQFSAFSVDFASPIMYLGLPST